MERAVARFERFWQQVEITPGCWIWIGSLTTRGYGSFGDDYKTILAHRMAWQMVCGPIPKGKLVLHHCDTPPCVRPSHLFLGTQADNIQDCVEKQRYKSNWPHLKGAAHPMAKMTVENVQQIRLWRAGPEKLSYRKIGEILGMSVHAVRRVGNGEGWTDVE